MKSFHHLFLIIIVISFLFISWREFLSVDQPEIAESNSTFDVPITISLHPDTGIGRGHFGLRIPIGWAVDDSISFTGIFNGEFVYSEVLSDSMEAIINPPTGYYWWVGVSDSVDSLQEGTLSFTPRITTDEQSGLYFLRYMMTGYLGLKKPPGRRRGSYYPFIYSGPHPISVGLAEVVTVSNTNSRGEGSLRQALIDVSVGGEIFFDLSYPATIVLDSQLVIDRNVTISGPDTGELILSGQNQSRVILIEENLSVNMSSLSISNGYASGESPDGGGIHCNSSDLYLKNVTISGNSSDKTGGGIYSYDSYLNLLHVTIRLNNASESGGGIYFRSGDVTLTNVLIAKNNAGIGDVPWTVKGGGICCRSNNAIFTNVTITESSFGGGLSLLSGELGLRNSILWHNSPGNIYGSGSIKAVYSNIQGGLLGENNIEIDPLFADTIDYYLGENSPCIDSGDPDTLFNDREDSENPGFALWPALGTLRNDMGAYGGHGKSKTLPQDISPGEYIESVDFINGEIGWMGTHEKIFLTEDGGENWENIPNQQDFRTFNFINESVGWAIGEGINHHWDAVFKTVDGGQNWIIQKEFPYAYHFNTPYAVNDELVYMAATVIHTNYPCGRIVKTLDGGKSWKDITPDNDRWDLYSVSFLDSEIGIVSGQSEGFGCILKTIDGGNTWSDTSWSESSGIVNLQFINDSAGYFLSDEGFLCRTTDKYSSWNKILDDVTSYSAVGENTILAIIAWQKFSKSIDGGKTWEEIHLGKGNINLIKFVDDLTGWIVWRDGSILKTTDGGNSWIDLTPAVIISEIEEDEKGDKQLPNQFKLSQNYPNPFNPSTTIEFTLPKSEFVELKIFNILGKEVATLVSKNLNQGNHTYTFNKKNLASGVYYYQLVAGDYREVKKMILLR